MNPIDQDFWINLRQSFLRLTKTRSCQRSIALFLKNLGSRMQTINMKKRRYSKGNLRLFNSSATTHTLRSKNKKTKKWSLMRWNCWEDLPFPPKLWRSPNPATSFLTLLSKGWLEKAWPTTSILPKNPLLRLSTKTRQPSRLKMKLLSSSWASSLKTTMWSSTGNVRRDILMKIISQGSTNASITSWLMFSPITSWSSTISQFSPSFTANLWRNIVSVPNWGASSPWTTLQRLWPTNTINLRPTQHRLEPTPDTRKTLFEAKWLFYCTISPNTYVYHKRWNDLHHSVPIVDSPSLDLSLADCLEQSIRSWALILHFYVFVR